MLREFWRSSALPRRCGHLLRGSFLQQLRTFLFPKARSFKQSPKRQFPSTRSFEAKSQSSPLRKRDFPASIPECPALEVVPKAPPHCGLPELCKEFPFPHTAQSRPPTPRSQRWLAAAQGCQSRGGTPQPETGALLPAASRRARPAPLPPWNRQKILWSLRFPRLKNGAARPAPNAGLPHQSLMHILAPIEVVTIALVAGDAADFAVFDVADICPAVAVAA